MNPRFYHSPRHWLQKVSYQLENECILSLCFEGHDTLDFFNQFHCFQLFELLHTNDEQLWMVPCPNPT